MDQSHSCLKCALFYMKNYFSQKEINPFEFKPEKLDTDKFLISVDGFEVFVKKHGMFWKLSCEEEFFKSWVSKSNERDISELSTFMEYISVHYVDSIVSPEGNSIIESPLYIYQDVFELENDNYDLKFTGRIRFNSEEFSDDLFFCIFEFCTPGDITRFQRTSKRFYQIAGSDIVWKHFVTWEKDTNHSYKEALRWSDQLVWDLDVRSIQWQFSLGDHLESRADILDSQKKVIRVEDWDCFNTFFSAEIPQDKGVFKVAIKVQGITKPFQSFIGLGNENLVNFVQSERLDATECLCTQTLLPGAYGITTIKTYAFDQKTMSMDPSRFGTFNPNDGQIIVISVDSWNINHRTVTYRIISNDVKYEESQPFQLQGKKFRILIGNCGLGCINYTILSRRDWETH